MNSLKERLSAKRAVSGPVLAAKRRRQLYPFFFHMGPVALCITSVVLVGLMAILYLSQLGQALAANQQLQDVHAQQAALHRQDQDLTQAVAQEQSPAYVAENAKKMGLKPTNPKEVVVLVVPHLQVIPKQEQDIQP